MTGKGVLSEEGTQAWTKLTVGGTEKATGLGKAFWEVHLSML